MSYYVTLSRPGAGEPYTIIYERDAGHYADGEIAPLGGSVELLRGGFCGTGSIRLSAPPADAQAGDWVRVYLNDSATPLYLGEISDEIWTEGSGELNLKPLSDNAGKAAWNGVNNARFADYLTTAIIRCALPATLNIGDIPDHPATLRADTPFELLSDTMQAAMPAIEGGTWGVTAAGQIGVHQPTDELTHRFVLGQAETEPGSLDGYANCVRFPYKKPDGTEAWYEGRATDAIAERGGAEVWEVTQAPAALTAENPYAGEVANLVAYYPHSQDSRARMRVSVERSDVFGENPTPLLPLPDLSVTWGAQRVMRTMGDEEIELGVGNIPAVATFQFSPEFAPGRLEAEQWGNAGVQKRIYTAGPGGQFQFQDENGTVTDSIVWPSSPATVPTRVRYVQEDVYAYYNAHGKLPPAFSVGSAGGAGSGSHVWPVTLNIRDSRGAVHSITITHAQPTTTPVTVAVGNFTHATEVQIGLSTERVWQANDTVTTNTAVQSVKALDGTRNGLPVSLTRAEDTEDGRAVWKVPENLSMTDLILTGDPTQMDWVGMSLFLEERLHGYALGLLRYRTQPVRSWTGHYHELREVPAYGMARFETERGDVDLDVQRVTYDLGERTVTVEAGTPMASSDGEAVAEAIESVRRETRTAGGK